MTLMAMTITPLRQVLNYFENSREGISINLIARELNISQGQVGSMVEFWVRKGKIRLSATQDCGSCSVNGDCLFVIEMPASYELVREEIGVLSEPAGPDCERSR